jgi:hypothetical protein
MDTGRGFVGQAKLDTAVLFGTLGGARCEDELQGSYLLMGGSHGIASDVGLTAGRLEPFTSHSNLDLTPVEQALQVAEYPHRESNARRWTLAGVHLIYHHAHPCLGLGKQGGLLLDYLLAFGEHLSLLVELALALLQRNLERGVRP